MKAESIKQFITLFLEFNPKPADAQVHALASALGVDKETLEAMIYHMLAECQQVRAGLPKETRVQEGDYDEHSTGYRDIAINDGLLDSAPITDLQDALADDGSVDVQQIQDEQGALADDGPPMPIINASVRLLASKGKVCT